MGTNNGNDDRLLEDLMADPVTAWLLLAWRKSVIDLERARAVAIAAGDEDLVRWVDGCVRIPSDNT